MEIVGRNYDISYDAGVYDFDVHMEVQMTHFGSCLFQKRFIIMVPGIWYLRREKGECLRLHYLILIIEACNWQSEKGIIGDCFYLSLPTVDCQLPIAYGQLLTAYCQLTKHTSSIFRSAPLYHPAILLQKTFLCLWKGE
jgi:hypothetical protein